MNHDTKNASRFRMVYERYAGDLFNIAFHCMGNREDAEDILQEVFIRYKEAFHGLSEDPKYWLIRVAVNRCMDIKRHMKIRLKHISNILDVYGEKSVSEENQIVLKDTVQQLMNQLNRKEKMVMVLKYMEEMDYHEISEIMNVPVGTLKSIASRAISKIRKDGK